MNRYTFPTLLAITLLITCAASAQIVKDSVCLSPAEFTEVYKGLKQRDEYKARCDKYFAAVNELGTTISDQAMQLRKSTKEINALNELIKSKQAESENKAAEISMLKERQKRFGIGPSVIYGVGKDGFGVSVGFGVHYNLIRF